MSKEDSVVVYDVYVQFDKKGGSFPILRTVSEKDALSEVERATKTMKYVDVHMSKKAPIDELRELRQGSAATSIKEQTKLGIPLDVAEKCLFTMMTYTHELKGWISGDLLEIRWDDKGNEISREIS
mgnify:CR=1 FL=1